MTVASILLEADGLTDITVPTSGMYELMPGFGPQGEVWQPSWARSPFYAPVPTGATQQEGSFFLPVRVIGTGDNNYANRERDLIEMVTQTVWTMTYTRTTWTDVYTCSASTWSYASDRGSGFDDLRLVLHKQHLAITVPCVKV